MKKGNEVNHQENIAQGASNESVCPPVAPVIDGNAVNIDNVCDAYNDEDDFVNFLMGMTDPVLPFAITCEQRQESQDMLEAVAFPDEKYGSSDFMSIHHFLYLTAFGAKNYFW